jgi:uncharacterized protein (DUF58 family)
MAETALIRTPLPAQADLQAFARAAAHLLVDRRVGAPGLRTVKRRAGVGTQHLDHRDYVPGDEVRHIDWRQTARRGRPVLRQFEADTVSDWFVLVDASSSMAAGDGAKWRAAGAGAAAICYALLELGHRVGLLVYGRGVRAECPRGRGRAHYAAIVRALAPLSPPPVGEPGELAACASRLRGDASAIVFSDFLGPEEMRRDLAVLLERCASLHAVQVEHPDDTRLDGAGDLQLYDVESGATLDVAATPELAGAALHERAAMTRRLRSFSARSGIAFSSWDVRAPWQRVLVDHLVRARDAC